MTNSDSMDSSNSSGQKNDVQSYLITRYRDALKSGDKSFAKSCLLSARLFSIDDPIIANEIYVMAKADGDITEAAKCFADIFENLFSGDKSLDDLTHEALVVANQIKEETRLLLNELKNQHLKLRSASGGHGRHMASVSQSPLLSPRLRMSSEDRCMNRDSVIRLDKHLSFTNKSLFYQQLLDHLDHDVRRSILNYFINDCDNPLERCRLMMLSISLFNDSVILHGQRLFKTLIDLSNPTNDKVNHDCDRTLGGSRSQNLCQSARSMLVLDAIPLIYTLTESTNLDFDMDELIQQTLNYFSEFCLEKAAEEYEFKDLHEGLRKTIAARILAKDMNYHAHEESLEENLNVSLDLLLDRFLHGFSNDASTFESLKKLRNMISRNEQKSIPLDQIRDVMNQLELENDIPESILFSSNKGDNSTASQATATILPPKGRGRPKKVQPTVIVSPDDGVRRHLQRKAKETLFIFTTFLQHIFTKSSSYLRQTRSRIILNFENPLANQIEADIVKSSSQRSSRAKNLNSDATSSVPSKKMKLEIQGSNDSSRISDSEEDEEEIQEESPLESEQSKKMDREIVDTLLEVQKCLCFLKTTSTTFERLYSRFMIANTSNSYRWFLRIDADCRIISQEYELAIESLNKMSVDQSEDHVKMERDSTELSTLTVSTGTAPLVEVYQLRALTQAIACNIQLLNKEDTFESILNLLSKIRLSGLLTYDSNYATGNVIDEYRILLNDDGKPATGFLFFDALSIMRYIVLVLLDILKRYVVHPNLNSDCMIGHAIVLSQVDWPSQVQIYDDCISWIRTNKPKSTTPQCLSPLTKFTYPYFFNYIVDPNIIEDFMALLNEGITLDIKSSKSNAATSPVGSCSQQTNTSTSSSRSSGGSTRSGKAITTRGVNKTFKEDLKVALIAQMKNSSPLVPLDLMANFVKDSLIPHLVDAR